MAGSGPAMTTLALRRLGPLLTAPPLLRERHRCFPHPGSILVRLLTRLQALAVARAVTGDDLAKLGPVDLAEGPVPGGFVEAQLRVRKRQAEMEALRDCRVDEFLAQLVVREALDLPAHRAVGVLALA